MQHRFSERGKPEEAAERFEVFIDCSIEIHRKFIRWINSIRNLYLWSWASYVEGKRERMFARISATDSGDISTLVGLGAILTGAGLLRRNCDRATSDISAHVSMWVRIRSRLERKVVRHFLHLAILSLLFWTAESLYGPSSVKNCHSGEFETVRPGARPVSSELQGSSDAVWLAFGWKGRFHWCLEKSRVEI